MIAVVTSALCDHERLAQVNEIPFLLCALLTGHVNLLYSIAKLHKLLRQRICALLVQF
jgi:hypothetical protein